MTSSLCLLAPSEGEGLCQMLIMLHLPRVTRKHAHTRSAVSRTLAHGDCRAASSTSTSSCSAKAQPSSPLLLAHRAVRESEARTWGHRHAGSAQQLSYGGSCMDALIKPTPRHLGAKTPQSSQALATLLTREPGATRS